MKQFFAEIIERRVIPVVGVYIGACWVLVEILDHMVDQFLLSPKITRLTFLGLYSLLPAVILIAWTHGKKGKDEITRTERFAVPVNLLATMGLMLSMASGQEIGSTAQKMLVQDELGQTREIFVPKAGARKSVMLFFWENESGDPGLDWMRYAIPDMLEQDLDANPFVLSSTPFDGGFKDALDRLGYPDSMNVSVTTMGRVAEDADREFFADGRFTKVSGSYVLTLNLYDSKTQALLGHIEEKHTNLLTAVDRLSVEFKEEVEVPSGGGRLGRDLPLSEPFTDSFTAIEAYYQGRISFFKDNSMETALPFYDQALAADPEFPLALLHKAVVLMQNAQINEATQLLRQVLAKADRIPATDQVWVKGLMYRLQGDVDKQLKILEMDAHVSDTILAHKRLAQLYTFTGRIPDAITEYETVLAKNPAEYDALRSLANLYRSEGDMGKAIAYAQHYVDEKPEDVNGLIDMGNLLQKNGQPVAAREYFERATLVDDKTIVPQLMLAKLSNSAGDRQSEQRYLEEAALLALTPPQKAQILSLRMLLSARSGKIKQAIDLTMQREKIQKEYSAPIDIVFSHYPTLVYYYTSINDLDAAEQALSKADELLEPPFDQFMQMGHVFVAIAKGEYERANHAIGLARAAVEQFHLQQFAYNIDMGEAFLAETQGRYAQAGELYRTALERMNESVVGTDDSIKAAIMAGVVRMATLGGKLDLAATQLEKSLMTDNSAPILWVEKARLHHSKGERQLALASIQYALALWQDADPEFVDYQEALELEQQIKLNTPLAMTGTP